MNCSFARLTAIFGLIAASTTWAIADPATFNPAGDMPSSQGKGLKDETVYYLTMRFPLEKAPAFANSQVNRPGGQMAGSQCAAQNYSYPWSDDFCESRQWKVGACPSGHGHQGQDIRPATCRASFYWAVAVDDGVIAHIGTYSVTLQTKSGTLFRYLHMNMGQLAVTEHQKVKMGDHLGMVANDFGGASTTIHLHFDIHDTLVFRGKSYTGYVPPYASLVASYKRLINQP